MSLPTISILGCGWLGFPLAKKLVQSRYCVKGSTTTTTKKFLLQAEGILPYQFSARPHMEGLWGNFFEADVLFLNIPFKKNLSDPRFYYQQIQSVFSIVEESSIKRVIFASSTSVYPDDIGLAEEKREFTSDNPRSKVLWDVEHLLLESPKFKTTILRFAGFYGNDRKIGQFLTGQSNLSDGPSPANFVHLDDCVNIVLKMIERDDAKGIFNVCSDEHPTRQELYTKAAQKLGLPPPQFNDRHSKNKIVSNKKVKDFLSYQFQHPNPILDI